MRESFVGPKTTLRIACIAATALVLCGRANAAGNSMPINFVGDWCQTSQDMKTTSYVLPSWTEDGHCAKILSINEYGFYGEGKHCEPVSMQLSKDTAPSGTAYIAIVVARCQPDGPVTAGQMQTFNFNRYKGNLTVALLTTPEATTQGGKPSFNCLSAKGADEIAICQTPKLSEMDVKLAGLYSGYRSLASGPNRRRLETDQAAWLQSRRSCGNATGCIAKAYKNRVDSLYQKDTPDVCDGPIMKQPKGCDPGGVAEITDEDVKAASAGK